MTALQVSAQRKLRDYVERAERLMQQQRELAEDVKQILADAKAEGLDPKIIRKVIAIRRKSKAEFQEEQAILDTYLSALGMLVGTPLGDYALDQRRLEVADA
jgi:uncharacterized protein (UPF0335 family)